MVQGLVPDANCEGHFQLLLRLFHHESRRELWHFLNLAVLTFEDLALAPDATDEEVWHVCQKAEAILITANRNADGEESLQTIILSHLTPESLPVFTLANMERIRRDRRYAEEVADRLLDLLFDIENLRGTGRVFVP